jgi:hypothetical protein
MSNVASKTRQQGWSAAEAFVGVMTLAAVHDVQEAEHRMRAVHEFAERSPFLSEHKKHGLLSLRSEVAKRIDAAGCDALEEACAALPAEMRASTYAACVDVLSANGALPAKDRVLVDRLRAILQIEVGLAQQIEKVLLLKNRF